MFESWGARHPLAVRLAEAPPGTPLVELLCALDLSAADDAAVLEAVAAWERVSAWVSAAQASVLAEMTRRATSGWDAELVGDEVAVRLGTTRRAAERKVELAVALDAAPAVHDALATGVLDVRKATVLTQETAHLDPRTAARIHGELLPGASERTAPQLRNAIRAIELVQDPSAAVERHRRARADRSVSMTPAPCSMAWLTAYLPADDALCVMTAVDALAASCVPEDERGLDARRADALVDVMAGVLDSGIGPHGELATRQHRRPHLQVTAAASTLLGLDEAPAVLDGYGPIPAPMARRIAAGSTWRPLLTDELTGEVVARSSRTYRPSVGLVGAVVDRDVTCTFPGCRVTARRCDVDHIVPFGPGRTAEDQTTMDNLQALCRHHHRMKTAGRWTPVRDPATGATTWESPTGHVYTRDPIPADPWHHLTRPPRRTVAADAEVPCAAAGEGAARVAEDAAGPAEEGAPSVSVADSGACPAAEGGAASVPDDRAPSDTPGGADPAEDGAASVANDGAGSAAESGGPSTDGDEAAPLAHENVAPSTDGDAAPLADEEAATPAVEDVATAADEESPTSAPGQAATPAEGRWPPADDEPPPF